METQNTTTNDRGQGQAEEPRVATSGWLTCRQIHRRQAHTG